jgi:hypothetical protein
MIRNHVATFYFTTTADARAILQAFHWSDENRRTLESFLN